jgi:hypothetical protein
MKGWTDIGSDVNWSDYGGKWTRRAKDGSWYVIDFMNMWDACGEEAKKDGCAQFVCEVKRVNLGTLDSEKLDSALRCVGLRFQDDVIVSDQGDILAEPHDGLRRELVLVEACVSYGNVEPIESFEGDHYPDRIRASARRYAETCARDAALLAERLARPVNAIGSTAAEYGRGDLDAALNRGPFDVRKNLMRKLQGMPPVPSDV